MTVVARIADWSVPSTALALPTLTPTERAHDEIVRWFTHLDVQIPTPAPVAFRWGQDGLDEVTVDIDALTDDERDELLIVHPEPPNLDTLASNAVTIVLDELRRHPGPLSPRRWKITRRVATWLYATGITGSGGVTSFGGGDPHTGPVYSLPGWRALRHRRVYVLGRMRRCYRDWS